MYSKFLAALLLTFSLFANADTNRPNIILITADDLGYDDLSLHHHPHITTPNLDSLARAAVQFSDFTVTPVCSTTRAALLTGRDFYKTGVSGVHGGRDFMHLSETLISEVLQDSGYKTATWGKWHLGKTEGYFPWNRGFDEGYYAELYRHKNSFGWLNGKPVQHNKWVSEVVTDYAIDFIQQQKDQPFFAYLSYLAPHEPWLAPEKFVNPLVKSGLRPAIANLYAMVNEMDFHIGRLIAYLNSQQLLDNTIIIFMSDNGPWWDSSNFGAMIKQEWQARNPSKMKGNKGQSWQNGIRSPLFIHWPKKWQASVVSRFVDVKDIFPTLLEVSQSTLPPQHKGLDGFSLTGYLEGKVTGSNPRQTYIASHDVISNKPHFNQWTPIDKKAKQLMQFQQQLIGLRTEKYKLLLNPAMDRPNYPAPSKQFLMFDMQKDPLEQTNIFEQHPDISAQLVKDLRGKFHALLNSQHTYLAPVYQVGNYPVSVVNGFGPSATTENVISQAHQLTNLKQRGDSATYQVRVHKATNYKIFVEQNNQDSVGLQVRVSGPSSTFDYQLNENKLQLAGTLFLPKGQTEITLEPLSNNSIKPWTAINGLRRLYFVTADSSEDPVNSDYPR